jgi:hypothetical protein
MTQLEVIRMIGDVLTEIDVVVGSLIPGDPNLTALQDLRRLLDARQLILSRQVFEENTERFKSAAAALKQINDEIVGSIRRIDDLATVIQNVTRFLNGVTRFLTVVGGVV